MRMMKAALAALLACLVSTAALAQGSVLQSGPPVANHVPMYVGLGLQAVLGDSGKASGGPPGAGLSELLLQAQGSGAQPYSATGSGPLGTNVCDYDGSPSNGLPYHYICFTPNGGGGALLAVGSGNGATPAPFFINVNGTSVEFPFSTTGVLGPPSSVVGHVAVWNNTTGTLLADGGGAVGTVSSVAMTVPGILSVTGSPITTAGTLAVSLTSQSQNLVFASPSGSSGTPTFRALLGADFGSQSANTVLAGPNGSPGNPTYRALVGADLPNPSASTLGGIESIVQTSHNWVQYIDTSGVPHLAQPSYSDLSGSPTPTALAGAASGFVNKLRGTTLTQWYAGTTITIGTSPTWTAEGINCYEAGANITATKVANPLTGGLTFSALKLTGLTSNTDLKCVFVMESTDSAPLAGQTVTFQIPIQNKSGGSLTPKIATAYPTTQNGGLSGPGAWGATTVDLASVNMQGCANNATCTEAYTFNASANAANGYEVIVDFGALPSNADYVVIGGGFDLRATPGVSLGLNSSPPTAEIYTAERDEHWSKEFYETPYSNGTPAATATFNGSSLIEVYQGTTTGTVGTQQRYQVAKGCTAPTITMYSPNNGATGQAYDSVASGNTGASVFNGSQNGFNWSAASAQAATSISAQWSSDCRITGG